MKGLKLILGIAVMAILGGMFASEADAHFRFRRPFAQQRAFNQGFRAGQLQQQRLQQQQFQHHRFR